MAAGTRTADELVVVECIGLYAPNRLVAPVPAEPEEPVAQQIDAGLGESVGDRDGSAPVIDPLFGHHGQASEPASRGVVAIRRRARVARPCLISESVSGAEA